MRNVILSLELELRGHACTPEALAFTHPDYDVDAAPSTAGANQDVDEIFWLPRSQIKNLEDIIDRQLDEPITYALREEVEVHVPFWLAEEKQIEDYAEEM